MATSLKKKYAVKPLTPKIRFNSMCAIFFIYYSTAVTNIIYIYNCNYFFTIYNVINSPIILIFIFYSYMYINKSDLICNMFNFVRDWIVNMYCIVTKMSVDCKDMLLWWMKEGSNILIQNIITIKKNDKAWKSLKYNDTNKKKTNKLHSFVAWPIDFLSIESRWKNRIFLGDCVVP